MKERIRDKANDLFHRYGVKSITMDEIAAQLGVSKKTIYLYYEDKNELVEEVARSVIHYSQTCCEFHKRSAKNAIDEIFQAMEFVKEMFSNMNPAMLFDLEKYHPTSYKTFLEHKNQYLYHVIRSNLERGVEEGYYRPDINIEIIAKFRLEGMLAVFNQDIFPAGKYNLGELHKEIIEHFLFGVASLKGYKLILKYQKDRLKSK